MKQYECIDCGKRFSTSFLASLIGTFLKYGPVCVDPAPTSSSMFQKPRCPHCGSKNLRKS